MRAVVQRVSQCQVTVEGQEIGRIGPGLLVLLGVQNGDSEKTLSIWRTKSRVYGFLKTTRKDEPLAAGDGGAMLIVSQFTLLGDCRKGRRPSFTDAAPPAEAKSLYERFCELVRQKNISVATVNFRLICK